LFIARVVNTGETLFNSWNQSDQQFFGQNGR